MAEEKKETKPKGDAPKAEKAEKPRAPKGGKKEKASMTPKEHKGVGLPVPEARLRVHYQKVVRPNLSKQFGFGNPHQIPTLEKIVINVGLAEAIKQPKLLDSVVEELGIICGQRPVRKKAKKSIANFGLREGQEIGAAVTLRGAIMWGFITVAVPRIRDFRGLSTRSFDGRGNYSVGIKEQMIFPEINYDSVEQIHGMDITFVTTAEKDEQALALLRELGFPFRGEEKPIVVQK
jgi:large subunit ribosomal protein L5